MKGSTGGEGAVDVVDAATNTVTKVVPIAGQPTSVAVGPGGTPLSVAVDKGATPGTVASVPLTGGGAVQTTVLPATAGCDVVSSFSPSSIAVGGTHGTTVVLLAEGASPMGCVDRFSVGSTPAVLTALAPLAWTTWAPEALAVDPADPGTAYVSAGRTTPAAGTHQSVAAVDLATGTVTTTAVDPVGDPTGATPSSRHYAPAGAAVSPDGTQLAVAARATGYFQRGVLWPMATAGLGSGPAGGGPAIPSAVGLPALTAFTSTPPAALPGVPLPSLAYLPDGSALYGGSLLVAGAVLLAADTRRRRRRPGGSDLE